MFEFSPTIDRALKDDDSHITYPPMDRLDLVILWLMLDCPEYRAMLVVNVVEQMFRTWYARAAWLLFLHLYERGTLNVGGAWNAAEQMQYTFFRQTITEIYACPFPAWPTSAQTILDWCRDRKTDFLGQHLKQNLGLFGPAKAFEIHQKNIDCFPTGSASDLEADMSAAMTRQLEYQEKVKKSGGLEGWSSFSWLDNACGGLIESDLMVIAARPGGFKTALAINLALQATAKNPSLKTCFLNLEMPETQMLPRFIQSFHGFTKAQFAGMELSAQMEAMNQVFHHKRLLSTPTLHLTSEQMVSTLDHYHGQGFRLFFVDYLQLIRSTQNYGQRDDLRICEAINALKKWKDRVKDSHICCLAQLSRCDNKRVPTMTDLAGSSYIEAAAAFILILYSDSEIVSRKDAKKVVTYHGPELINGWIAKNRHGVTGPLDIVVDKPRMRVFDTAEAQQWMDGKGGK